MKRIVIRAGCAVIAVAALTVATALAVEPNKGAVYEQTGSVSVSFEVSHSGKSITGFKGPSLHACGVLAPGSASFPKHAKISHGAFVVKEIVPAHSKDDEIVSGHFTAHGAVKGTVKVATQCLLPPNFNSGPVKHKTFHWSATSEPAGPSSRYCLDLNRSEPGRGMYDFSSIIVLHTTCPTADHAIKAGKFTKAPPPDTTGPPVFTTPGWACERNPTSGRYTCTRHRASFSWLEGV